MLQDAYDRAVADGYRPAGRSGRMKICVLQASYEGSSCDYQHYDPPRILSHLLPEHEFHHEFLKKVSTYRQIKALARQGFDIFVNLCEGYLDSDVPSIDVIFALEHLNLPFTGPTSVALRPAEGADEAGGAVVGRDHPGVRRRRVRRGGGGRRRAHAVSAVREARGLRRQHGHRRPRARHEHRGADQPGREAAAGVRAAARRGVHRRPRVHGARVRAARGRERRRWR